MTATRPHSLLYAWTKSPKIPIVRPHSLLHASTILVPRYSASFVTQPLATQTTRDSKMTGNWLLDVERNGKIQQFAVKFRALRHFEALTSLITPEDWEAEHLHIMVNTPDLLPGCTAEQVQQVKRLLKIAKGANAPLKEGARVSIAKLAKTASLACGLGLARNQFEVQWYYYEPLAALHADLLARAGARADGAWPWMSFARAAPWEDYVAIGLHLGCEVLYESAYQFVALMCEFGPARNERNQREIAFWNPGDKFRRVLEGHICQTARNDIKQYRDLRRDELRNLVSMIAYNVRAAPESGDQKTCRNCKRCVLDYLGKVMKDCGISPRVETASFRDSHITMLNNLSNQCINELVEGSCFYCARAFSRILRAGHGTILTVGSDCALYKANIGA
ncbi:hypothetical protein B0T24DRAFT_693924 [Lasiosphaeria ovina]|uniref:Uncharacterized protein n=1 Tax=Lasiosphaeria ovina TaxID=92902 RepID=A0AAE0KLN4_9PEZI|nr:hypothetical protein B0T24DRAFT_693924 [Lasiosphaeria ovina]